MGDRKKIHMHLCSFHKLYKLIVNLTKKWKANGFLLFKMTWKNGGLCYNKTINSGTPEKEGVGQHELHN